MKEAKQAISFGSPKSFSEAIYHLPHKNNMTPSQRDDEEMMGLSEVRERLEDIFGLLERPGEPPPILYRTIEITLEELELMEKWSFKRSENSYVFLTWDDSIKYYRAKMFSEIISPEQVIQNVNIWKIEPGFDKDFKNYVFICFDLEANESYDETQFFLAVLDEVEYDILIGCDHD